MRLRDFEEAERLVTHAKGLRVNYGPFEAKPEALLERIAEAKRQAAPAAGAKPGQRLPGGVAAATPKNSEYPNSRALFDRDRDTTRNARSTAQDSEAPGETPNTPEGLPEPRRIPEELTPGAELIRQGEQVLKDRDTKKAMQYFQQAYGVRDQLDAATVQRLQDRLQMLATPPASGRGGAKPGALLDSAASAQLLLAKQVSNELAQKETAAGKIRDKDPKQAMQILKDRGRPSKPRASILTPERSSCAEWIAKSRSWTNTSPTIALRSKWTTRIAKSSKRSIVVSKRRSKSTKSWQSWSMNFRN